MSTHPKRRRRGHEAACAQVSIPASDMNDQDEEIAVFCRQNGDAHDLPFRHHASLRRLRGDPAFAGLVIVDDRRARCPRCGAKLDWRPVPKMATITPLHVVR